MSINGSGTMPLRAGANTFTLPAGTHRLAVGMGVYPDDPFRYGVVTGDVQVSPGQTTTLHYTPPSVVWARGVLGPVRRSKGRIQVYILVGGFLAVFLYLVISTYGPAVRQLIVEHEWPDCIETRVNNYDCSDEGR